MGLRHLTKRVEGDALSSGHRHRGKMPAMADTKVYEHHKLPFHNL